jgi:hypothetical protein
VPALITKGRILQTAANETSIYVREATPSSLGKITQINKADCSTRELLQDPVVDMAVSESMLYTLLQGADGHQTLSAREEVPGSTPYAVSFQDVLQTNDVQIEAMAADGTSLYVVVSYAPDPALPSDQQSAVLEVPCCGESPRMLGTTSDPPSRTSTTTRLVHDGTSLYWLSVVQYLDAGPQSKITRFDTGTGVTTTLVDASSEWYGDMEVVDGVVYLEGSGAVSALQLPSCAASALVDGRGATITAFTLSEGNVFWAEAPPGLAFSRLFWRAQNGVSPRKIVDTAGTVTWMSVDATDVYWSETDPLNDVSVFRIARP